MILSVARRSASRFVSICVLVVGCVLLVSCREREQGTAPMTNAPPGASSSIDDDVRWEFLDRAGKKFTSLKSLPKPERHAALVSFLKASDLVADAGVAAETDNVWACFKDNRVILFFDNRALQEGGQVAHTTLLRNVEPRFVPSAVERLKRPYWASAAAVTPWFLLTGTPLYAQTGPPFAQGTELPVSRNARLLNTLDSRWTDSGAKIDPWLSSAGYVTSRGHSEVSDLAKISGDGVFFWATHAGSGEVLNKKNRVFGMMTETKASPQLDKSKLYKDYWDQGYIVVGFAEFLQPNGSVAEEPHYAITQKFVRDFMHFDPNSLVYVSACTSAYDFLREAFYFAGAGAYVGWDAPTSGSASVVDETFFDLLLGQDAVNPQKPRQRPFNIGWIRSWMLTNNKHKDPQGTAGLVIETKGQFALLRPTIFRVFVHDTPADKTDYIEIEGEFGNDPGNKDRAVTIGGVAQADVTWTPHGITLNLPLSGNQSYGDITVQSRGHLSNVAQLTRWRLPLSYTFRGRGSLTQKINVTYVLRGDISGYRNEPYGTPFGTGHAISSSKEASGTYQMSGVYRPNPNSYIRWKGGGALRGARNFGETLKPGFVFAAGNVRPSDHTISQFVPRVMASFIEETKYGSTPMIASFTGFGIVNLNFDRAYVLKPGKLGPVSVPGGTATLTWPSVKPDNPFNDGGR